MSAGVFLDGFSCSNGYGSTFDGLYVLQPGTTLDGRSHYKREISTGQYKYIYYDRCCGTGLENETPSTCPDAWRTAWLQSDLPPILTKTANVGGNMGYFGGPSCNNNMHFVQSPDSPRVLSATTTMSYCGSDGWLAGSVKTFVYACTSLSKGTVDSCTCISGYSGTITWNAITQSYDGTCV